MVSPRDLAISPSPGSAMPAMQRSKVDLPRPLAATSPMRSPALTERSSRENSGAFSVTPRLRMLIRLMVVPWSCRPTRRPGHAAIDGRSCWRRRATQRRGRTIRRSTPHCRGGRPGRDFSKSLWSALQTHLQGVDGATLAIVPEKCRHCAALLSRQVKIAGPPREGKPGSHRNQIAKAREVTQAIAYPGLAPDAPRCDFARSGAGELARGFDD